MLPRHVAVCYCRYACVREVIFPKLYDFGGITQIWLCGSAKLTYSEIVYWEAYT